MRKKAIKSIVDESREIQRAIELIKLGARLQVLETEIKLSRERLLRLYKEIQGKSPPKGMLPFSTDWFMTWQPNVHSSLFMNIYEYLNKNSEMEEVDAIIKAYKLYLEQMSAHGMQGVLSLTRAWRLVKFFDAGMLTLTGCKTCKGHFVVHTFDLTKDYVCGLCHLPSRAGKTVNAKNNSEKEVA
ncbi:MAG TPA: flagellar transcriptional regulator FlhC [Burkholderiales bacterium]|nr:flagellar transcriptional regulator FlhC [Burkholderiales bacterium]